MLLIKNLILAFILQFLLFCCKLVFAVSYTLLGTIYDFNTTHLQPGQEHHHVGQDSLSIGHTCTQEYWTAET